MLPRMFTQYVLLILALLLGPPTFAQESPLQVERDAWFATSESGLYRIEIGPESGQTAIGKWQSWVLVLKDAEDAPVFPARFAIGGGMEGHGHGLPTQPQVTGYLGEGMYRIEGFKFNMAGAWTLFLMIDTEQGLDKAKVELDIDF